MLKTIPVIFCMVACLSCRLPGSKQPEKNNVLVKGWTILTEDETGIGKVLKSARKYEINHLQLSHQIIMDLRQVRQPVKQEQVNQLITRAHEAGIKEVVVWDHALYELNYYPEKFRTGPDGALDLDNSNFWEWFRNDYREMMAMVPGVDGLVLTFVETGARAELQFSRILKSSEEKLAKVVNNVADVVIGELGKKLYIRTFAYNDREYGVTIGCIEHLRYKNIILMMKETPHDFFLTHPNDKYAGTINRPTVIEFDAGNEYSGQDVIANTWPEYILKRWGDLKKRKNVIGYVARTDRYNNTTIIGRPSEILLRALKSYSNDTTVTPDMVYDEFITSEYGPKALSGLKPAFKTAFKIVTSSLYTLGTNTANHSALDFDPYQSSYARSESGRWIDPPVVLVNHDVNRTFHYWQDIIQHIAPARFKNHGGQLEAEAPWVLLNKWVTPEEKMDEEFLSYLIAEKEFGVKTAELALDDVKSAKPFVDPEKYNDVYQTFYRTLLTTRLYSAVTKAYFGYRIYARGESFRTKSLIMTIRQGLTDLRTIAGQIKEYSEPYPKGQWDWKEDADTALKYYNKITGKGWTEYGGIVFHQRDFNPYPEKPLR